MDHWNYLEQWIEDCFWDELANLDWALDFRPDVKLWNTLHKPTIWEA